MVSKIELKNIVGELNLDALLEKPYHKGQEEMFNVLKECLLNEEFLSVLKNITGRPQLHLLRLLRRSQNERAFAIAYIEYIGALPSINEKLSSEIKDVIGSEGYDTKMFWTFAPYLFLSFTKKGLNERFAIKKILDWSKSGISDKVLNIMLLKKNPEYDQFVENSNQLNLKGLEIFNAINRTGRVLDKNPDHISHKFTEQEADRIAESLLNGD